MNDISLSETFVKPWFRDTLYHVTHSLYHVRSSSLSLVEGKVLFSTSESDCSVSNNTVHFPFLLPKIFEPKLLSEFSTLLNMFTTEHLSRVCFSLLHSNVITERILLEMTTSYTFLVDFGQENI